MPVVRPRTRDSHKPFTFNADPTGPSRHASGGCSLTSMYASRK